MIQGTTPTLRLKFPFDARLLDTVEVNFIEGTSLAQEVVLTKTITSDMIVEDTISITLTQDETRLMEGLATVEVRAKTKTGGVIGFKHVPKWMRKTIGQEVLR